MTNSAISIHCEPCELTEGLFGQVFLYVFEVLPYLHKRSIFPDWEIRSTFYGEAPDYVTIPGVLDLAYTPPAKPFRRVALRDLRERHCCVLGNDWSELSRIWHSYFKIPESVVSLANNIAPLQNALGLHYRGTDKQTSCWATNPIYQDEFVTLSIEFLKTRPGLDVIFIATDEYSFVSKLRQAIDLPVINLGQIEFFQSLETVEKPLAKANRALLDCLLLSRCRAVLQTSSALSSFAKILNPDLEIYRTAASKMFADIPYFPVSYVPKMKPASETARRILEATMVGDWTTSDRAKRFQKSFSSRLRTQLENSRGNRSAHCSPYVANRPDPNLRYSLSSGNWQ